MRYLLDTHVLFWGMSEIYFSSASVWEVVIKHNKNPRNMPISGQEFVDGCLLSGYIPLSIDNQHILAVGTLNRGEGEPPHNDPFDRILIAQAKTENMIRITHDGLLSGYHEECIMKI